MVARKHGGLGKGLGALIPDKIEETKESVNTIDINLIKANEEQLESTLIMRRLLI